MWLCRVTWAFDNADSYNVDIDSGHESGGKTLPRYLFYVLGKNDISKD